MTYATYLSRGYSTPDAVPSTQQSWYAIIPTPPPSTVSFPLPHRVLSFPSINRRIRRSKTSQTMSTNTPVPVPKLPVRKMLQCRKEEKKNAPPIPTSLSCANPKVIRVIRVQGPSITWRVVFVCQRPRPCSRRGPCTRACIIISRAKPSGQTRPPSVQSPRPLTTRRQHRPLRRRPSHCQHQPTHSPTAGPRLRPWS